VGNLLAQDFTTRAPNQAWLTDITSIATDEGRLYTWLGTKTKDMCTSEIVGYIHEQSNDQNFDEPVLVSGGFHKATACRIDSSF
jgi:putative transposase